MESLVKSPPADFAATNEAVLTALGVASGSYTLGKVKTAGVHATAEVTESYTVPVLGPWAIETTLSLVLSHDHWRVLWSPATIDPALGAGDKLALQYSWPERAAVLASDGTSISPSLPTSAVIGLEGDSFKGNTVSLAASLVAAGAPEAAVKSAIASAEDDPSAFVPVFTVDWGRYEQLRPTLYPIPGVFFEEQGGTGSSTPAPLVGVVGSLGAITAAQLKQYGTPYDSTSVVGQSGIEQAYERQLAGTPGATISVLDAGGTLVKTLASISAKPGTPVRTTIDLSVEQDAAQALATVPQETALVAIDAATGQVIAAANSSQGSDLALEGEQPPGSTMKIITSTALIDAGLTPESPATCPPVINVDGENLHNAETNEGSVPDLLAAFTVSCNTAFIGLTMANLNFSSLHDAALQYQVGGNWDPGLPVFTGSVPVNDGQTDLAASAIGQSRVVLNPLDLAMVAADVDTGTARLPWITDGAPTESAPTSPLPAVLVSDLHEMMLSVVEDGTAAGTGLPPGTYAKTGTAEYGTSSPLLLDAWLAGFNGEVAFAMVDVDSPGNGGPTDGPIIARFLDSLGSTDLGATP
jgi:cell division protein FtsI/penicillin-binding protein 2